MKLHCLGVVAVFLLGVSHAVCTRQPPSAYALVMAFDILFLPASSCGCSECSTTVFVPGLIPGCSQDHTLLPACDPILHLPAPARCSSVDDAHLGLL